MPRVPKVLVSLRSVFFYKKETSSKSDFGFLFATEFTEHTEKNFFVLLCDLCVLCGELNQIKR